VHLGHVLCVAHMPIWCCKGLHKKTNKDNKTTYVDVWWDHCLYIYVWETIVYVTMKVPQPTQPSHNLLIGIHPILWNCSEHNLHMAFSQFLISKTHSRNITFTWPSRVHVKNMMFFIILVMPALRWESGTVSAGAADDWRGPQGLFGWTCRVKGATGWSTGNLCLNSSGMEGEVVAEPDEFWE